MKITLIEADHGLTGHSMSTATHGESRGGLRARPRLFQWFDAERKSRL
jgi:hypothetical protein